MLVKAIVLCLLISSVVASTSECNHTLSDVEVRSFTCSYGNNSCVNQNFTVCIDDSRFSILITITAININGANGDYLLIKSGKDFNDGLTGRVFTWHISKERQYISLSNEVLISFRVNDTDYTTDTANVAYRLTAQRYGEIPEDVVGDIEIPCPRLPEYYEDITVNMTVRGNLTKANQRFTEEVALIAQYFVESSDNEIKSCEPGDIAFLPDGDDITNNSYEITPGHVHIRKVITCPLNWPHGPDCLQYTFAVVICICKDSSFYGTYQLNHEHLVSMWKNAENYFNDTDESIIVISRPIHVPRMGIAVIWIIIILLSAFYLIIGNLYLKYVHKKTMSLSKIQRIEPSVVSPRMSNSSLTPHPYQTQPQIFENDMLFYEPDSSSRYLRGEDEDRDDHVLSADNLNLFAPKNRS